MCRSTYGATTNNHEEADTLLIHCIMSSKLDDRRLSVYASNFDFTKLIASQYSLLSCGNFYVGVSSENTKTNSLLEFLGSEHAKCLLTLHCLTGCDAIGTFFQGVMDKIVSTN